MKILKAFIFYLIQINLASCQSNSLTPVKVARPSECDPSAQFFDISSSECKDCPLNSRKIDLYNCKCNDDHFAKYDYGGGSIVCEACPSNQVQSSNGFSCVECNANCRNCDTSRGILTDTNQDGTKLSSYQCIICNSGDSKVYDSSCRSCFPFIFSLFDSNINTLSCSNNFLEFGSILINSDGSVLPNQYTYSIVFGTESVNSEFVSVNLISAFTQCRTSRRNATACQVLANMCVLNIYTIFVQSGFDACEAFFSLRGTNQESIFWGQYIPWLVYPQSYASYFSNYENSGLGDNRFLKLSFEDKCESSTFEFYANQYNLDGSFHSGSFVDISKFQLCNYLSPSYSLASKVSPFSATNYNQSCLLPVSTLLEFGKEPKFFELFLKFDNSSDLLPIPVKFLDYRENGLLVNLDDERNQKLHRRFFMVDAISSKQPSTPTAKYIRYVKSFVIFIRLRDTQTNGEIYPPLIIIDYDYVSTDDLTRTVEVSFEIAYSSNFQAPDLAMWITSGILALFSLVWAFIRALVWNRRSGKVAPDLITLFKFTMFICSSLGNVFFLVLVAGSLYWLIFYKGQGIAYLILPNSDQQAVFIVMLVLAFVFKLIDVLHLVFSQTSFDIFFIDWERPTSESSSLVNQLIASTVLDKGKEEKKNFLSNKELSEYNRISCWRTLFVANEWNEIQTFRKIDPLVQLIGVLFFLKVINLEAITTSDCNTSISPDPNAYQAEYSGILRIAMAASMYIGVGILQYVVYEFFYIRCISDKIGQFIDFCSVANISMFIMTHTQYGYYIHGRSPHGNSDVSMQNMSKALSKEENEETGKRGLGQNSDQQTFSIFISSKLSNEYSKVMIPLFQKKSLRKSSGISGAEFDKRVLAYNNLNKFLMGYIDNILRNLKYKIVRRNFFENIFNIEFRDPTKNGYFFADENRTFETVLFCGQEQKLFIFDLMTFLFVDYFAKNYVLAAFCVFLVIKVYNTLRNDLGKRNLSRKTLVDKRFLI
ncbi:meckelin isoform X1 [Brachionus plicatilis]|uniref:Meckelin isoform X1 n=1 Tax=Brachionus plicatilis TaxID=10195 RepID=A0A3M7Q923_BRAPC|nr:meckelin isoform X1 [Brachionus plicatilis]